MDLIAISTAGKVDSEGTAFAEASLGSVLGVRTRRIEALPDTEDAWDPGRRQHSSTLFLREAVARRPADAFKIVVLTEYDIFIPMLTFVYGQAQLGGPAAVVSFARLRQEFYGLPPDRALFLERVGKESLHEVGHTLGLTHCGDRLCTMSLSTTVQQLDFKRAAYCEACRLLMGRPERDLRPLQAAGSLTEEMK
ncbi:MAG: archaemetzincin family Zn-dependent metalloprotease [Acidobacteria bacterium]|nr:archaemetzincin family Zn-dependent metalloprotease [Acidobacteriota bacterium]